MQNIDLVDAFALFLTVYASVRLFIVLVIQREKEDTTEKKQRSDRRRKK